MKAPEALLTVWLVVGVAIASVCSVAEFVRWADRDSLMNVCFMTFGVLVYFSNDILDFLVSEFGS